MTENRLELSEVVAATPERIFALVCDPTMHVAIDGSGMLVAAADSSPLTGAGDSFVMNMDREPLGDIPLGKYRVRNTVTRFEPNRRLEWNVGGVDQPPFGHVYGYELQPAPSGGTTVTLYCDWSGVRSEAIRDRFPIVPPQMLQRSLTNLARLAADPL
jgi:hypothetical protein